MINMIKCLLVNNRCYQKAVKIKPTKIVVHSTGANNKTLKRYVQPKDNNLRVKDSMTCEIGIMKAMIGNNPNGNDWNRNDIDVCVHGFLGLDAAGTMRYVQTLPYTTRAWGVGSGSKGSYNDCAIQFEICEDSTNDKEYASLAFKSAIEVCAALCKEYNLNSKDIVSHKECCALGYGSNHGDPEHWWNKHGFTMDMLRKEVQKILDAKDEPKEDKPSSWANDACKWSVDKGLFTGDGKGNYGWQDNLTREQLATILYKFHSLFIKGDVCGDKTKGCNINNNLKDYEQKEVL